MEKNIQNLRPASSSFRVSVPKEKKKKKNKGGGERARKYREKGEMDGYYVLMAIRISWDTPKCAPVNTGVNVTVSHIPYRGCSNCMARFPCSPMSAWSLSLGVSHVFLTYFLSLLCASGWGPGFLFFSCITHHVIMSGICFWEMGTIGVICF